MREYGFAVFTFLTGCAQQRRRVILAGIAFSLLVVTAPRSPGAVGDVVATITPDAPTSEAFFSVGLAFDGANLYVNRNGSSTIYIISPVDGSRIEARPSFDTGISEWPAAMSYDAKRNGLWIGTQKSLGGPGFGNCGDPMTVNTDMPIYFWDFDDDSVTLVFTIPSDLTNPANGQKFFRFCRIDGLVYNENDPSTLGDDELWFSDMLNANLGVFRPDGTFVSGFDATAVEAFLGNNTGLAIGADRLYMTDDGLGDVFRASPTSGMLIGIDQDPSTSQILDPLTSGGGWLADMACDSFTFSPTEVIWVRTSPQDVPANDLITAYEIEPGGCGPGLPVGACCDPNNPPCRDVPQAECNGNWTEGVSCAVLDPPCFPVHRIFLLDRTGSMETAILDDGRTRCRKAWETMNTDIQSFFQTHPIGSSVAVWTFAGAGATPLTTGFVDQATAIGALAPLGNTPCDNGTPLADAACDTIDALVASFPAGPKETRELSISSDGLENNSDGPCSGPNSLAGMQCGACGAPDSFDCGSWQQLVCDHAIGSVVALVKLWGDDGQRFASGVMDSETGALRAGGVPDAVFFQALADATGGTYTFIADNPPAPSGPPAFGVIGACCLFDGTCQNAITEAECAVLNGTHQGENSTCAGLAQPCVSLIPTVSEWGLIAILLLVVVTGMLIFTRNARVVHGWRRERFDGS